MKNIKSIPFLLTISMLVAFSPQAPAQNATVVKGPPYKMSKTYWYDIDPIGDDATGHYYLFYPNKGNNSCLIGRASQKTMGIEEIKKNELIFETKELELQFGFELGGISYIFSSFQNNKLQKVFLFAHVLDRKDLTIKKNPVPVAEIDYSKFNKYKISSFSYRLSPDGSKVLFLHILLDTDNSLLASGFKVADQYLKLLHQTAEIAFEEAGVYRFENYYLSNSGEVLMLTKHFDKKKDYKKNLNMKRQGFFSNTHFWEEEANFDYKLIKTDKGSRQKTFTFSLPNVFITQVDVTTKDDGGILCLGFYSENEDAIPDGIFSQEISDKMAVIHTDQKDLEGKFNQPLKYVNNTYDGHGLFNNRDDLTNFRFAIKKIIRKKSGGYAFAAERRATLSKTYKTGSYSAVTYGVFHTDDILLADVMGNGKINWIRQIEKSQETIAESALYSSFDFEEHDNNLMLFFTNFVEKNLKITYKVVGTESVMVLVRPDGTSTRQVIFTDAADKLTITPDDVSKAADGSFMVYGRNGTSLVGFFKVSL